MRTVRVILRGLVQGVGFRYYAWRRAEQLGLAGTVRNLRDGRVEVVAKGPEDAISSYLEELRHGPMGSHVTALDVEELAGTEPLTGFQILG
jgi:acylphosphatase